MARLRFLSSTPDEGHVTSAKDFAALPHTNSSYVLFMYWNV
jgi:hypothetical protein